MKIILLVGASGSGKTTIGKRLEDLGIPQLISHTTRIQRHGEVEGKDYYFVNKKEIENIEFIESSTYDGNTYGLSKKELLQKTSMSDTVYFITDKHGAKQIQELYPEETEYFWVSIDTSLMIERMVSRGDKWDKILKRINHSQENLELYPPSYESKYNVEYTELRANVNIEKIVVAILRKITD